MAKKVDLRTDLAGQIGAIAKLAKGSAGLPVSSLEMEIPNDPVEGESDIPTTNVVERISEIDDTINDAVAELEQAKLDIAAAKEELAATQVVFDETFVEHADKLAYAEEALEVASTRVESMNGDITNAVVEAEAAKADALAAMDAVAPLPDQIAAAQAAAEQAALDAATAASDAAAAAADVVALVGKTGRLISSGTAPTGDDANSNNLWLNTSTGELNEWTGSAWQVITDERLSDVIAAADQAQNLANNAKTAAETAQSRADAAAAAAQTAQTAAEQAQTSATTAGSAASAAQAKADSAYSNAATAQSTADTAKSDAAAAAGIANGKADVLIQSTAPATAMRKATTLWIDTTGGTNTPKRWSGSAWVAVTDKKATDAASAAATAQSTANQAVTDAANAKSAADAAAAAALAAQSKADDADAKATTASGLYTVATANPTAANAAGKPIGAVWEVRSGSTTLRRYVLTSATTWTQVKIGQDFIGDNAIGRAQLGDAAIGTAEIADAAVTNAKIGDLDVGKLTVTGASKFQTAVMQALIADSGFFDLIYANKVIVAGENLLPDPLIQNLRAWRNDSRISTTGGRTGGGSILIPASTSQAGIYNASYAADMPYAVKVTPGQRYNLSAWFTSAVAGVGTTNKVTLYERFFDGNGASIPGIAAVANAVKFSADTWTKLSGESRVAPDDAVYMAVGFYVQSAHNSEVRFSDPSVRSMTDGDLLVEGSVKARHVVADEVAAAVGVFIDAMMTNLSVTGVAAIKQVTTDALWAKLAVVDRLQVLTKIITRDMIATGAVTADKVVASQALIDKLITPDLLAGKISTGMFQLGDNWRWTDEALVAYAPVVGNQSVTDWANRQELFRIDPSGGISFTAATTAGDPTGGIDPDGSVWGTLGSFDELEVGGVPVTNVDGPRGVQSVTMLGSDTTIGTNTETRILWTTIDVEPGRIYEIETQVFARDPGNITLRYRRNTGAPPTTSNSIRSEMVDAGTMHRLITFKHIMVQPLTGGDNTAVETRYVGLFLAGSANQTTVVYGPYEDTGEPRTMMIVRDLGPTVEIDAQEVASTSSPKRTYTKTYKTTGVKRYTAAGGTATDSRNITAGSVFGSAMSEKLLYQMPAAFYSDLQGATIKSAKITVRCTKTYSTGSVAQISLGYTTASGLPSTWPSYTAASAMDIKAGQALTNSIPSNHFNGIRSARGITVTPRSPGSLSSYAYFDATSTRITVTYEK